MDAEKKMIFVEKVYRNETIDHSAKI